MAHKCSEPVNSAFCNEPCKKTLECGHQCTGKCGEPCKACPACMAAIAKFKRDAERRIKDIEARIMATADTTSAFILEEVEKSGGHPSRSARFWPPSTPVFTLFNVVVMPN